MKIDRESSYLANQPAKFLLEAKIIILFSRMLDMISFMVFTVINNSSLPMSMQDILQLWLKRKSARRTNQAESREAGLHSSIFF